MDLRDVMTPNPTICQADATAADAATLMRDLKIGDVLVQRDDGRLGIVTDRDIVTRACAGGRNPQEIRLDEICTDDVAAVTLDTSVEDVIRLMGDRAVRRVPVVDGNQAVGIVALGDLARVRDPRSLLGHLSDAPPNN